MLNGILRDQSATAKLQDAWKNKRIVFLLECSIETRDDRQEKLIMISRESINAKAVIKFDYPSLNSALSILSPTQSSPKRIKRTPKITEQLRLDYRYRPCPAWTDRRIETSITWSRVSRRHERRHVFRAGKLYEKISYRLEDFVDENVRHFPSLYTFYANIFVEEFHFAFVECIYLHEYVFIKEYFLFWYIYLYVS